MQIIAENVSGKPFPQFMQDAVLRPLGMTHSFYGNPETFAGSVVVHNRRGWASNLAASATPTSRRPGSTRRSADFTKFVMGPISMGGAGVLNSNDVALMETAAPGTQGRYGLGYFVERLRGDDKVVGHGRLRCRLEFDVSHGAKPEGGIRDIHQQLAWARCVLSVMCGWYRSLEADRTDYCGPMAQLVVHALYSSGEEQALALNARLARIDSNYSFGLPYWNYIGYSMLERHSADEAVPMFHLLTRLYPDKRQRVRIALATDTARPVITIGRSLAIPKR